MSWRDRYTGKGKFRDAEFLVRSSDMVFGRRTVVHEYPKRDDAYVEDLGLKSREFTLEAFVIGADYHIARDNLIAALEMPGAGTLVHPYLGTMRVSLKSPPRKRESNKDGGRCEFTLNFIISSDKKYPDQQVDTQNAVDVQAEKSLVDSINDFSNSFSVLNLAEDVVQNVENEIDNVMGAVENVVGTFVDPISTLIRTPANMAASITGSISSINTLVSKPGNALNIYKNLFSTGDDSPSIPTTTASRRQQAASVTALHNLIKRSALIEACRASSQMEYDAYEDAIAVRDSLLDELDTQMHTDDVDDIVYLSLLDLRVAVNNDIRSRGADLTRLKKFTPLTTLPALVISHQLYGDASREGEVVARNNIRHPGFVQGGNELEVLNV